MGTCTVTVAKYGVMGNRKYIQGTATLSNSYATGGDTFNEDLLGVSVIENVVIAEHPSGYVLEHDATNSKIKARMSTPGPQTYSVGELQGSANTDSENTDASSLPEGGKDVADYTAVSGGAWTVNTTKTNPDVLRNVCIVIYNDSGGSLNLYEGVMTFTVTGTDRNGASQTETITFTSNAGNKAVANTKYRYKYGVKAFATVTNVTLDNVPDNGLKIGVGIGSKLGLPYPISATTDVTKAAKNGATFSLSGNVNATYGTINFGSLADDDSIVVYYNAVGEVNNGRDMSAVSFDFMAFVV